MIECTQVAKETKQVEQKRFQLSKGKNVAIWPESFVSNLRPPKQCMVG